MSPGEQVTFDPFPGTDDPRQATVLEVGVTADVGWIRERVRRNLVRIELPEGTVLVVPETLR